MHALLFHKRFDRLELLRIYVLDKGDALGFFENAAKIFGRDRELLGNRLLRGSSPI